MAVTKILHHLGRTETVFRALIEYSCQSILLFIKSRIDMAQILQDHSFKVCYTTSLSFFAFRLSILVFGIPPLYTSIL